MACTGGEDHLAADQGHRAADGIADGGQAQRVAVDVAVIGQQHRRVQRQRGLERGGEAAVRHRHRRVVHRGHRHRHGRDGGAAVAVRDGVAEAVGAVEIGVGGVGHHAAHQRHRAMRRRADRRHRQAVAVHVAVVQQHRHHHRGILGRGDGIHHRDRRVVHRRHRQRHRRRRDPAAAVRDLVGEAVGAVVVGIRRVGEGPVGVEHQRAMRRAGQQHRAQRVAVRVAVVAQHPGRGHRQHPVLGHRIGIRPRDRLAVERGIDRHGHGCGGHPAVPVRNSVGKAVGAAETGIRCIGEDAVPGACNRAGGPLREAGDRHRVAIRIEIVSKHRDPRQRGFEGGRDGICTEDRRIVHTLDDDRAGGRCGQACADLLHDIAEGEGLAFAGPEMLIAPVGVEGQRAIRAQGQDAPPGQDDRRPDQARVAVHRHDADRIAFGVEIDAVAVVGKDAGPGQHGVLVHREGIVLSDHVVVFARHRERGSRSGAEAAIVRDGVGEAVGGTLPVGQRLQAGRGARIVGHVTVRRDAERRARGQHDDRTRRIGCAVDRGQGERIVAGIAVGTCPVAGKDVSGSYRILVCREEVVAGHGGGIGNRHGEAVGRGRAVVVRHRHLDRVGSFGLVDVHKARRPAAGVEADRPVAFAIIHRDRPGIGIRIGQRDGAHQRRAFGNGGRGPGLDRHGVVDRRHVDLRQRRRGAVGAAVRSRPAKAVQPVGIGIRHIGQGAGRQLGHCHLGAG